MTTLLSALRHNVGDPQPPLVSARALWTVAVTNGSLSMNQALRAMDDALKAGQIIRWTDGEGTVRYGLTADGIDALEYRNRPVLSESDADELRRYLEVETQRENPSQEFVGWVNRRLAEVQS
jgi:hypothetical protein